jgi:hypothetical protein
LVELQLYAQNSSLFTYNTFIKIEILLRGKEERNILHAIKRWEANWIGKFLHRNCLLKHIVEGKTEGIYRNYGTSRKKT